MNALTVYGSRLIRPAVLLSLIAFAFVMLAQPQGARAANTNIDVGDIWFCNSSFSGGSCDTFIQAGDTVTWNWIGALPHNVTECGTSWNKGLLCTGGGGPDWASATQSSGSYTPNPNPFDTPGVYYYLCTVHPFTMRGTITVGAAVGGIAELPSVTASSIEDPSSPSNGQQLLIALAAGGAAAVAVLGGVLWYMRRRLA